jgi:hypothetical protein
MSAAEAGAPAAASASKPMAANAEPRFAPDFRRPPVAAAKALSPVSMLGD